MSRHSEEIMVDDKRYLVTHYSTEKGMIIQAKLGKILGKPVGLIFGNEANGEKNPEVFGDAFQYVFSAIPPEEFPRLAKDIISGTKIYTDDSGFRDIAFDVDFSGRYKHLYQLIFKIVQFQFDFLSNLAGFIPAAPVKVAQVGRIQAR